MGLSRIPDDAYVLKLRALFAERYGHDLEFALTPEGDSLCEDKFFIRAVNYYTCMLPWIQGAFPLAGASVVEVGCGSGAATLALAQKCAHVDSFDIDPVSIDLARERAAFVGVHNVHFHLLDPDWALPTRIGSFRTHIQSRCDVVLLPAVLEHLRMDERLAVLETMWGILRSRGAMVIYDTPNRLYAYDMHSFRLPFFNWLPDDLALLYTCNSPRKELLPMLAQAGSPKETLYRIGRGVSYHEFDLSIGLSEFEVIADGYSNLLTHRAINDSFEGMLLQFFERYSPHVPPAFSKQYLEMVLRKKWDSIALAERHLVTDQLLEGRRPALVVEGEDSYLRYNLKEGLYRRVVLEVLMSPWGSTLLVCDESGVPFYKRDLYSEYKVTEILEILIPENIRIKASTSLGQPSVDPWRRSRIVMALFVPLRNFSGMLAADTPQGFAKKPGESIFSDCYRPTILSS
jgi:S-adenosylmethionine-dependent methyltransferase